MIRNLLPFTGSNSSEVNDDEATADETPDEQAADGDESQFTVTVCGLLVGRLVCGRLVVVVDFRTVRASERE